MDGISDSAHGDRRLERGVAPMAFLLESALDEIRPAAPDGNIGQANHPVNPLTNSTRSQPPNECRASSTRCPMSLPYPASAWRGGQPAL
jgi:hypothetical protein